MTLPAFLFGFLISSLFGSLFHLWRGGSLGRLLLYLVLAWAGFWAGHFLAELSKWSFGSVGPLHMFFAIIGCLLFLLVGYWLSLIQIQTD